MNMGSEEQRIPLNIMEMLFLLGQKLDTDFFNEDLSTLNLFTANIKYIAQKM